jgi:starch synthase
MTDDRLSIAHLASEMTPFARVGGLGDAVGSLAAEQARAGHRVIVTLPAYRSLVIPPGWRRETFGGCEIPWGMGREPARYVIATAPGGQLRVLLLHHDGPRRFLDRGGIYDDPDTGQGYPDNAERILFFTRAALEGLKRLGERFDIVHGHDHHAGWGPCFVQTHDANEPAFERTGTVFTIHNLGYQGIYDSWVLGLAGFGREVFYPASPFEFFDRVNYMKVGLAFADQLSTVSPTYAKEIQTTPEAGVGLEGVLRRRGTDLRGILNGIDVETWNPASDPHLATPYDACRLEAKDAQRAGLAAACGFADASKPIVGMVTRLVEHKGLDLLEAAEAQLLALDARFVVQGVGQPGYREWLRRMHAEHPDRFHFHETYDESFAHRVFAGSDVFLMPSRTEPCGLAQMVAMRYGTPPVVRATGGLVDTVRDFDPLAGTGTGFAFEPFDAAEMVAALRRALALRRQTELWRVVQRNGMARDSSWGPQVGLYDALYRDAIARVAREGRRTVERVRAELNVEGRK